MLIGWPKASEYKGDAERYRKNAVFFREAPVLVFALSGEYKSIVDSIILKRGENDPLAIEMIKNRQSAPTRIQQIGGFVAHLLLVLHSFGIGARWMAAPLVAKREIENIIQVHEGRDLVALIPLGYPDETPSASPRKTINEFVTFIK